VRKITKHILKFLKIEIFLVLGIFLITTYGLRVCISAPEHWCMLDFIILISGINFLVLYYVKHRRNRKAVQQLKEYYKSIVEILPHGVCECNTNGVITFANKALHHMMGAKYGTLLGKHICDIIESPSDCESKFKQVVAEFKETSFVAQLQPKEGLIEVLINIRFKENESNCESHIVIILTDVSELYITKEELRSTNEHLEQLVNKRTDQLVELNKELEAFTSSVSHDLSTPLRSITAYLDIIRRRHYDDLDDDTQTQLARMERASRTMEYIIRDLLKLSRATISDVKRIKCNVSAMASSIAADIKDSAVEKRAVTFEIQDGMYAYADQSMLYILYQNLLSNAWKYTSDVDHPVVIKVGCLDRACMNTDIDNMRHSIFYVDDNGIGFDMKHADKLFEPFHKLKFDKKYEGSGIGLSIVYRIIKKHLGDVWAEAEEGEGTTVYFILDEYNE